MAATAPAWHQLPAGAAAAAAAACEIAAGWHTLEVCSTCSMSPFATPASMWLPSTSAMHSATWPTVMTTVTSAANILTAPSSCSASDNLESASVNSNSAA